MAKTIGRLTHQKVGSAALEPGLHGDGGNLYLRVGKDGNRSWVFIYRYDGKQRELGLGRAGKRKGTVSLADARDTAKKGRALLDQQPSVDPRTVWRAQPKASARTFAEAAKDYIAEKEPGWKNAKHIAQWHHTIKVYCKPIANTPVDQIGVEDVRSILTPIWRRAPETASRVRVRIAAIIDHACPSNSMQPNPARLLAKQFAKVKEAGKLIKRNGVKIVRARQFPRLALRKTPRLSPGVCARDSVASRGLEFLLLTASRTSEVIGAKWIEIDLSAELWVIPPERLKTGKKTRRPHAVPLSPRAIAILEEMREIAPPTTFSPAALTANRCMIWRCSRWSRGWSLPRPRTAFVRHFATGLARTTDFAGELAELALGHVVAGVEGRYRRGTAIDRRRALMSAWDAYLAGPPPADADNVLPFARSA